MSYKESVTRLFRAYDRSADSERAKIYLERVKGFTSLQVAAGVARVLDTWTRVSLPPVAILRAACLEIATEDRRHRAQQRAPMPDERPFTPAEKAHCGVMRRLFDAGLEWCEQAGAWLPAPEAKRLSLDDPDRQIPTLEDSREALELVARGDLVGDEATRKWRATDSPLTKTIDAWVAGGEEIPPPSDAEAATFD